MTLGFEAAPARQTADGRTRDTTCRGFPDDHQYPIIRPAPMAVSHARREMPPATAR
jgi:hypothetical protein